MYKHLIHVVVMLSLTIVMQSQSFAEDIFLQPADFHATADQAAARQLPILVFFSSSDCENCEAVEQEFLRPMLKSGDYADKVIFRVVHTDSSDTVRDFNGGQIDSAAFAERFHLELTPTIVLLDAQGNDLQQRLMGMSVLAFYGGYLDEAINSALQQVRK